MPAMLDRPKGGDRPLLPGVLALIGSSHPGPGAAVTVIGVVLAIGIGLEPWRVALLGFAFAANQASIGLSNDWLDAERDRSVGRTDKPVALGTIAASSVRTAAIVSAALALILTVPLGLQATVVHAVFIGSAWAYNLGLKRTALSVLPYIVSFGLLSVVVTSSSVDPRPAAGWAVATGALLGAAAHFANVLPDLDDDRATGVHGLPHRLGPRVSGIATFALLLVAAAIAFAGPDRDPAPVSWAGLVSNALIALAGTVLVLTRPLTRTLFRLIIVSALIDVVMLASAGEGVIG